MFLPGSLESYASLMDTAAGNLIETMRRHEGAEAVNVLPLFEAQTMETVVSAAFGQAHLCLCLLSVVALRCCSDMAGGRLLEVFNLSIISPFLLLSESQLYMTKLSEQTQS